MGAHLRDALRRQAAGTFDGPLRAAGTIAANRAVPGVEPDVALLGEDAGMSIASVPVPIAVVIPAPVLTAVKGTVAAGHDGGCGGAAFLLAALGLTFEQEDGGQPPTTPSAMAPLLRL